MYNGNWFDFLEIILGVSRTLKMFIFLDPKILLLKIFPTKVANKRNSYAKCFLGWGYNSATQALA